MFKEFKNTLVADEIKEVLRRIITAVALTDLITILPQFRVNLLCCKSNSIQATRVN